MVLIPHEYNGYDNVVVTGPTLLDVDDADFVKAFEIVKEKAEKREFNPENLSKKREDFQTILESIKLKDK